METKNFSVQVESANIVKLTEFLVNQEIPFMVMPSESQLPVAFAKTSPLPMFIAPPPYSYSGSINVKKRLSKLTHSVKKPERPSQSSFELNALQLTNYILEKYITKDFSSPTPSPSLIINECGISIHYFKRIFREIYDKSFFQLYLSRRMERAAELLKSGYSAKKVGEMVGYQTNSAIKFNKMFQKHFGITPKRFQNRYCKEIKIKKNLTSEKTAALT